MFSIGGNELSLTEIVSAFIISILVLKGLSGVYDLIISKLEKYRKHKNKNEKTDESVEDHAARLDNIEKSLNEIKKQNEKINELLANHDNKINEHSESLEKISGDLEILLFSQRIQFRHSIVRACEEYLSRPSKEIESKELESLSDMYNTYTEKLHGNSYVHIIFNEVKKQLTVVAKYKEDGDI